MFIEKWLNLFYLILIISYSDSKLVVSYFVMILKDFYFLTTLKLLFKRIT